MTTRKHTFGTTNQTYNASNTNQEYPQTNIAMESHSSSNYFTPVQQNPLPFLCCPNRENPYAKQKRQNPYITIHVLKTNKKSIPKKSWLALLFSQKHPNIQRTGQSVEISGEFWIPLDPLQCPSWIPGLRSIRPNVQNATTCWIAVTKKALALPGNFYTLRWSGKEKPRNV